MVADELDGVDEGILFLLQQNARRNTTTDISEYVDVSSSTVANRIQKLEDRGVIAGYHPALDYEEAGMEHHLVVVGTVDFDEQPSKIEELIDVTGVVGARELLTHEDNVELEVVRQRRSGVEETLAGVTEVGMSVSRVALLRQERVRPFDGFGSSVVDGD